MKTAADDRHNQYLILVCGYGCHRTPEMRRYLTAVVTYARMLHLGGHWVDVLYSGGYTNKASAPGLSEAYMMETFAHEIAVELFGRGVTYCERTILDRFAISTFGNLYGAMWQLRTAPLSRIEIFCDSCRAFKINVMMQVALGYVPRIHAVELTRDPKVKLTQVTVAAARDVVSALVPSIEQFYNAQRLRRMARL